MKLAVVVGGWHFPLHFYKKIAEQKIPPGWSVDFFCVSHRDPSLAAKEKEGKIDNLKDSRRLVFDRLMYEKIASEEDLEKIGWKYSLEPNTVGDWGISNQWLEKHDYRNYDLFLFSHDDNFILNEDIFIDASKLLNEKKWLILTNSIGTPPGSLRGSFEFFTKEMMSLIGGRFDLSRVTLTREGKFDSGKDLKEISDWNNTVRPLKEFIDKNNLNERIVSLSPYYRMSVYCLEGERGYIHKTYHANTKSEELGLDEVAKKYPDRFKKIVYLSTAGLPTDWAHGIQIMKMCETFSRLENVVELVMPRRSAKALLKEDLFSFYNVARSFKITRLFCIDLIPGGTGLFNFLLRIFSFLVSARLFLLFKRFDILYTREQFFGFLFPGSVYELHYLPKKMSFFHKLNWRKAKALIVLTSFIKEQLISWGVEKEKILIAGDAVDLKEFSIDISKEEARKKLSLPLDKKIILYTGSFFTHSWKGVDVLLESSLSLSDDYLVVFVGGNEKEIERVKREYSRSNLCFIGQKPHKEIPYYLKAADVLVLPNKKGDDHSEKFTSPLKLFEYMAAERPIIASGLPSIREILNDNNALLVEPNDSEALAGGIKKILQDRDLSDRLVKQVSADILRYTWQSRAQKILEFISSIKLK